MSFLETSQQSAHRIVLAHFNDHCKGKEKKDIQTLTTRACILVDTVSLEPNWIRLLRITCTVKYEATGENVH